MTAETTQAKQYFRTWDLSECIKHRCSLSSPQEINQSRHAIRREEKRSQASPSPGAARVKADRAWGKTGRTLPEQEYCSGLLEMVHAGGRTYHSGSRIREVHHIGHEAGTDIRRERIPFFRFFSPSGVRTAAWSLMM